MARGPDRPWRAQRGPLLDGHILAAVQRAAALVEDELAPGVPFDAESAAEFKRALFRAARRQGLSVNPQIEKDPVTGRLQVRFTVFTKEQARAYVIAKYGPDRTKWPYNPRYRAPREDS